MRLDAILREAGRNISSGTARTVLMAALLALVVTGLVVADLVTVRSASDTAVQYQRTGASIVTMTAPGRIDGAACDALSAVPNVRAGGAARAVESGITASALPSSAIPLFEVTSGFPAILSAAGRTNAGVHLSRDAADALGVAPGDAFASQSFGSVAVAGVFDYPSDGRRPGFGYAALAPVNADAPFDECWVDVWPTSEAIPELLQTTLTSGGPEAEAPVLAQLNSTLGRRFDGAARFEQRITRFAPLAAGAVALGLGIVSVRTRRIQFASALHAGIAKSDLARITGLEVLSWVAPSLVFSGAAVAVLATTGPPDDAPATVILAARIVAPAIAGAFVGAGIALGSTREAHLFRYFKDR